MRFRLFFREEILNLFVGNDLGLECVSAGLFGLTILIHLVNALPVPVLSVATTFFAMIQPYLISR